MSLRTGMWCIAIALAGFLLHDLIAATIFQLATTIAEDNIGDWFGYLDYASLLNLAFGLLGIVGGILCAGAPTRLRIWFVLYAVALALELLFHIMPLLLDKAGVDFSMTKYEWMNRFGFLMWIGTAAMFAVAAYRWTKPALVWIFISLTILSMLIWLVLQVLGYLFGTSPDLLQSIGVLAGDAKRGLWIVIALDMLGGFRARGDTTVGTAARTATIAIAIGMCVAALVFAVIAVWSASKVDASLPLRNIVTAALYIGTGVFALVWRR